MIAFSSAGSKRAVTTEKNKIYLEAAQRLIALAEQVRRFAY
jgi:hypothetical protein